MVNFNDGTFAWGIEGNFYLTVYDAPNQVIAPVLRDFYYNDGKYHAVYATFMQFIWIVVLAGVVLNLAGLFIKEEGSRKDWDLVISLALIGLTVFVVTFEARARYLYVYVPIYILMGISGYAGLKKILDRVCFKQNFEKE